MNNDKNEIVLINNNSAESDENSDNELLNQPEEQLIRSLNKDEITLNPVMHEQYESKKIENQTKVRDLKDTIDASKQGTSKIKSEIDIIKERMNQIQEQNDQIKTENLILQNQLNSVLKKEKQLSSNFFNYSKGEDQWPEFLQQRASLTSIEKRQINYSNDQLDQIIYYQKENLGFKYSTIKKLKNKLQVYEQTQVDNLEGYSYQTVAEYEKQVEQLDEIINKQQSELISLNSFIQPLLRLLDGTSEQYDELKIQQAKIQKEIEENIEKKQIIQNLKTQIQYAELRQKEIDFDRSQKDQEIRNQRKQLQITIDKLKEQKAALKKISQSQQDQLNNRAEQYQLELDMAMQLRQLSLNNQYYMQSQLFQRECDGAILEGDLLLKKEKAQGLLNAHKQKQKNQVMALKKLYQALNNQIKMKDNRNEKNKQKLKLMINKIENMKNQSIQLQIENKQKIEEINQQQKMSEKVRPMLIKELKQEIDKERRKYVQETESNLEDIQQKLMLSETQYQKYELRKIQMQEIRRKELREAQMIKEKMSQSMNREIIISMNQAQRDCFHELEEVRGEILKQKQDIEEDIREELMSFKNTSSLWEAIQEKAEKEMAETISIRIAEMKKQYVSNMYSRVFAKEGEISNLQKLILEHETAIQIKQSDIIQLKDQQSLLDKKLSKYPSNSQEILQNCQKQYKDNKNEKLIIINNIEKQIQDVKIFEQETRNNSKNFEKKSYERIKLIQHGVINDHKLTKQRLYDLNQELMNLIEKQKPVMHMINEVNYVNSTQDEFVDGINKSINQLKDVHQSQISCMLKDYNELVQMFNQRPSNTQDVKVINELLKTNGDYRTCLNIDQNGNKLEKNFSLENSRDYVNHLISFVWKNKSKSKYAAREVGLNLSSEIIRKSSDISVGNRTQIGGFLKPSDIIVSNLNKTQGVGFLKSSSNMGHRNIYTSADNRRK